MNNFEIIEDLAASLSFYKGETMTRGAIINGEVRKGEITKDEAEKN